MRETTPRRNCSVTACRELAASFLGSSLPPAPLWSDAMGLADPAHRSIGGLSIDPYVTTLTNLCHDPGVPGLHRSGTVTDGRSVVGDPPAQTTPILLGSRALYQRFGSTGSPARLMVHIEEVQALATEHGFPFYLGWALAFRGRSLTRAAGKRRKALRYSRRRWRKLRRTGGDS